MKIPTLLFLVASIYGSAHATVIVADSFSGSVDDDLDGQSAPTFAAGITAAGGSAVWGFDSNDTGLFKANGEVAYSGTDTGLDRSIRLTLGTYINDAKGTANGKFTLTATVAAPTGSDNDSGTWATVGFFSGSVNAQAQFTGNGGLATAITRRDDPAGNADFFPGPGTASAINVGNNISIGTQTFTTVIDFTPAGGYDGVTNFGTVTFTSSSSTTPTSFTYTSDQSFDSVGFSINDSARTTFSNFSVSQIPEPSAAMLWLIGVTALLRRTR